MVRHGIAHVDHVKLLGVVLPHNEQLMDQTMHLMFNRPVPCELLVIDILFPEFVDVLIDVYELILIAS